MKRIYRLFSGTALLLAINSPAWSADTGKEPVPSPGGMIVSFKMDARLASGNYGGERWVSPPAYVTTLKTVDARVQRIDVTGASVPVSAEWTAADPAMVTVSP